MIKIFTRGNFTPIGREGVAITVSPSNSFKSFQFCGVNVNINADETFFSLQKEIEIDPVHLSYLNDTNKTFPRNDIVENKFYELQLPMKKLLSYLKYYYGIYELDENFRFTEKYHWSLDNIEWSELPDKRITTWRGTNPLYTLPDHLLGWFPSLSGNSKDPFYGFIHLHKAFAESDPRHQWINATIAAELAFKEFLPKLDPRTISLMEYVPSPPILRLYKNVLKDFTGEDSPYFGFLNKGAEKRNELIHKPKSLPPSKEEADIYMHQVEAALFHLYSLLYSDDPFFTYLFHLAKEKLARVENEYGKGN